MSSSRPRPRVLVIGAVPPPYAGPYLAMQRLVASAAFRDRLRPVFLDISDHRDTANIGKLDPTNLVLGLYHAAKCILLLAWTRPRVVYLGISQGTWGLLRDLSFLIPATCLGRRLVLHLRGSEFGTFYSQMPMALRLLCGWMLRRVHTCILLGESLRHVMMGILDPSRLVVIPNGLDVAPFASMQRRERSTGGETRVLFLSHLMSRKGIFEALEAFGLVRSRIPNVQLTMAGGWQNHRDEHRFEQRLDELGLRDRVRMIGVVVGEEKMRAYSSHDIFLFPPVQPEGLPWVILEAMAAGLPVVTTNQGAIGEVVVDGETGFVCEPKAESLAQRLHQLASDPGLARSMGDSGRRRVEERFSERAYQEAVVATLTRAAE